MIYQIHRGGYPENTMAAFRRCAERGFEYVETDPVYTRDGKVVLMHDPKLNRTCRRADGSPLEKPTFLSEVTYDELMTLDAGLYYGEEYRGERVPLLSELLELAEKAGFTVTLDNKLPLDRLDTFYDVVAQYKAKVAFACAELRHVELILKRFPDAEIHFDGIADDATLTEVKKLVGGNRLFILLYLDRPNFSWLKRPKVSAETCALARRYGLVGIGNILSAADWADALSYRPDMVESNGEFIAQ